MSNDFRFFSASMAASSSPLSTINEIQRNVRMRISECYGSPLRNHQIGFDEHGRKVYMSGEVHEECLDKGKIRELIVVVLFDY